MSPEKSHKFNCKICDYHTSNKKDYNKHLSTLKHQKLLNTYIIELDICTSTNSRIFECECGKTYKHRQSLNNHKQKCKNCPLTINEKNTKTTVEKQSKHDNDEIYNLKKMKNKKIENFEKNEKKTEKKLKTEKKIKKTKKTEKKTEKTEKTEKKTEKTEKTENLDKIFDNDSSLKEMFFSMIEQNKELTSQIVRLAEKPTTVNHSNNTNFNLNVFLNETCKDAINIDEFIETLKVGLYELKYSMDNGIVDGVSNLLINGLGQMETSKRPIHCTDQEKKTLYIKEDNTWERNNEKIVNKTINDVHKKYIVAIKDWEDANPNWNNDPKLVEQYVNIAKDTMTTLGIKKKELIIDRVSKEVELEEHTDSEQDINIEIDSEIDSE